MKILLGYPDMSLADRIGGLSKNNDVISLDSAQTFLHTLNSEFDLLILSTDIFGEFLPWQYLTEIREKAPDTPLYVALTDAFEAPYLAIIQRLAVDLNFRIISINQSTVEIFNYLNAEVFNGDRLPEQRKKGKVVAFLPTAPDDGATTTINNTALLLAKHSNLKIAVFDLNLKSPDINDCLILNRGGKSLEALLPDLKANDLSINNLHSSCATYKKYDNLYFLTGSGRRELAEDFHRDEIKYLLDVARETFDLIFVDLNCYPDNAATVTSFRDADLKILVTQPITTSYQTSWRDWYESFWRFAGIEPESIKLVVNRAGSSAILSKDIASITKLELYAELPNVPSGMGVTAINEGKPLVELLEGTDGYVQAIYGLAHKIAATADTVLEGFQVAEPTWMDKLKITKFLPKLRG